MPGSQLDERLRNKMIPKVLLTSTAVSVLWSTVCRLVCFHGVQFTGMTEHPVSSTLQIIVLITSVGECVHVMCEWGSVCM